MPTSVTDVRVPVTDSISLHTRDYASNGAAVSVLIHGSAEGNYVWDRIAPKLADHCRVVAISLRGHGDSDQDPDHNYTLQGHVADVLHLIRRLGDQPVILIGHSLGGSVALHAASRLGSALRGLVVVDAGPTVGTDILTMVAERLRAAYRVYDGVEDYLQATAGARIFASREELRRLATCALRQVGDGQYLPKYDPAVVDTLISEREVDWWLPALQGIRAPVQIIRGMASGVLSDSVAQAMARAAPRAQVAVVAAAGHAVMSDNPDAFASVLLPFVRSIASTPAPPG